MVDRPARRWLALCALALLFVSVAVLARVHGSGPQRYGIGAEYIEHTARLQLLDSWRHHDAPALSWLAARDGGYPPLLHVAAAAAGSVLGHDIEEIAPLALLWVALLALGVGLCVHAWTRSTAAAAAAAALTTLLPAISAVATRYYYDLPMTAVLWLALGVLLAGRRRPVLAPALAGLLLATAALIKWTALPFGALALICAARDRRSAARALGAGSLAAVLLLAFCSPEGEGSFAFALRNALPAVDVSDGSGLGWAPDALGPALSRPWRQISALWSPGYLLWFPLALVVAVLSPAGALVLLPLAALGLHRERAIRGPLIGFASGGVLFLASWVHVQDERFLLTFAPAITAAAGVGLHTLGRGRSRAIAATITVAVLAAVGLDFHFGAPAPWNRPARLLHLEYRSVEVVARGLGLASSDGAVGWARGDEQPPARRAYRWRVWEALLAANPRAVATVPGEAVFEPDGDDHWLTWRATYANVVTRSQSISLVRDGADGPADVLLRRAEVEPGGPPLERVERIRDPAGGVEVALWRPPVLPATPLPRTCADGGDGLAVTIAAEPGRTTRCRDAARTECAEDYLAFLRRPEVAADALSEAACDGELEALYAAREARTAPWPQVALDAGADLGAEIEARSGLGDLLDRAALRARPLRVAVVAETLRSDPKGRRYREQSLILEDELAGEIEALLLLPTDGIGPFPSVLVLPGHTEDAATHRDQRYGWAFPAAGMAALILTLRAYEQPLDHDVTRGFLCSGRSFMAMRAYEGLLAMKFLLASPLACNARLGILGHSGGSLAGNLLAWLDANPARAYVSDGRSAFWNVDRGRGDAWELDCETHQGLFAINEDIGRLLRAPRPVRQVPYAYAPCQGCDEPSPDDLRATDWFVPFFADHLGAPLDDAPLPPEPE